MKGITQERLIKVIKKLDSQRDRKIYRDEKIVRYAIYILLIP